MRRLLACLAVLMIPAAARAEWREARSPHFQIYSQGSEKSLRMRAERLEAVHHLMLLADGLTDEPHPYRVRVFVVPDAQAVRRMMQKPDENVVGFYRGDSSGPIAFTPENTAEFNDRSFNSQVVLFHEYAHHFMLQNFPAAYPGWFIEGRAELISTASFEKPGLITYGKAADHRRDELDYEHGSASEMLLKLPKEKTGGDLSYGDSWLLTHYLTFSPERRGQLVAFLGAVNSGKPLEQAATAFGDMQKLNRDVTAYLRNARFSYREVPIPATIAGSVAVRTLGPDEAAMLPLVMEFTKPTEGDETKAFLARAEMAADVYPDSAFAQQFKAEVEVDAEAYDAAITTTDHLLKIAPQSARAHYWRGAAMLAKAGKIDGDRDAAVAAVAAARREIVAANRLDPDDPLPLIAYYHSYGVAGQRAPGIAFDGLVKAFAIVPQAVELRFNYANALVDRGDKAGAVTVLKPLAFDPHGGESAAAAKVLIDKIEEREPSGPAGADQAAAPKG